MTRLQRLYKELGDYLLMLTELNSDDEIVSKIERKCKPLVEAIKRENQNIFD
jgi:hypothetical protein